MILWLPSSKLVWIAVPLPSAVVVVTVLGVTSSAATAAVDWLTASATSSASKLLVTVKPFLSSTSETLISSTPPPFMAL